MSGTMSPTSPTLPSGYTEKRRIGSIRTGDTGNILAFVQSGDEFFWGTPIANYNSGGSPTAQLLTVSTPFGIETTALLIGSSVNTDNGQVYRYISSPLKPDVTPSTYYNVGSGRSSLSMDIAFSLRVRTNLSSQVRERTAPVAAGMLRIYTEGWVDRRGRDD